MNSRERHLETLLFGNPDRIPFQPGHGRKSTRERWLKEGLPEDVADASEYAYRLSGGTLEWPHNGEIYAVSERMRPQFEEKVIERLESSQIVQDWKGNVCKTATTGKR